MCIGWTNKELNSINMHSATTKIVFGSPFEIHLLGFGHVFVEDHQLCFCVSSWLGPLPADVFKMVSALYLMQLTFYI